MQSEQKKMHSTYSSKSTFKTKTQTNHCALRKLWMFALRGSDAESLQMSPVLPDKIEAK